MMKTYKIVDRANGCCINHVRCTDDESAKDSESERDAKRLKRAVALQSGWLQTQYLGGNLDIVACNEQGVPL